jgi:hypothetical protein
MLTGASNVRFPFPRANWPEECATSSSPSWLKSPNTRIIASSGRAGSGSIPTSVTSFPKLFLTRRKNGMLSVAKVARTASYRQWFSAGSGVEAQSSRPDQWPIRIFGASRKLRSLMVFVAGGF